MPEHRLHGTTLGTDTRHEEGEAWRDGADACELVGGRGPHDQAHGAARSPTRGETGYPFMQPLARYAATRVSADLEILELAGPRVGRPAEHVGEAIGSLEKRGHRLRAEVRADGDRVGPEDVEERHRLPRSRRPDVAPFGVRDDREVGRQR